MLKWRQIQAILDRLDGRDPFAGRIEDLDEPWRTMYRRVVPVDDPVMAKGVLWEASEGLQDRAQLVDRVVLAMPGRDAQRRFESLNEMGKDLPKVEWLWPSWIPRGMLSLLGAAAGAGKSLLALDLARRVIHGKPFPDGAAVPCPGSPVIYVDAEAIPQILYQRARAWGMDDRQLYPMTPPETFGMLDLGDPAQQAKLIQMIDELQPYLVVVDSLGSISMRGENQVEEVRELMGFLGSLASEFDLALLLIHHLRKRGNNRPLPSHHVVTVDDFRGSSHLIAMARSVLGLSLVQDSPFPTRNATRQLEVLKTNLCEHPAPLGLSLEKGERGVPLLRYGEAPVAYREQTQANLCAEWLFALLKEKGEPITPKDVVKMAAESGFRRGTVYRARGLLGRVVADTENRFSPNNRWRLRGRHRVPRRHPLPGSAGGRLPPGT